MGRRKTGVGAGGDEREDGGEGGWRGRGQRLTSARTGPRSETRTGDGGRKRRRGGRRDRFKDGAGNGVGSQSKAECRGLGHSRRLGVGGWVAVGVGVEVEGRRR